MIPLSVKLGNILYKAAYPLYQPLYFAYKFRNDWREISLLRQIIHPGNTVLDIGANVGFYTTLFSKLTGPTGKVISLESDTTNFRHLVRQTEKLENVTLIHGAAGPANGITRIYLSDMLNVDHRTYEPESYTGIEEVRMYSLDDLTINGRQIDFVKIDIQGFEMQAFQGMKAILRDNKNIRILTEYWPHGLKMAGNSGVELIDFLTDFGFNLKILSEDQWIPIRQMNPTMLENAPGHIYYNIYAARDN